MVIPMHQVFRKEMDGQGRIILPKEWRRTIKTKKVVLVMEEGTLKILPAPKKLSSFFEKARPSALHPDPFENYEESVAEASMQ